MFNAKVTIKEKENRLINIIKLRDDIEHDYKKEHPESIEMLKAYHSFEKLSDKQRQENIKAWNEYYAAVKETPIYALFKEQREAARQENTPRLKDLALQARQMKAKGDHITLEKPKGIDPWEFNQGWVMAWKDCIKEIELLRKDLAVSDQEKEQKLWGK